MLSCRGLLALGFCRRLLLDLRRCHARFPPFYLLLDLWPFHLSQRLLYWALALWRRHLGLPLNLALLLALFDLLAALRCGSLIRNATSLIFTPRIFSLLPTKSVLL